MGRHRQPLCPRLRALSEQMRVHAAATGGMITATASARIGADPAAIRRLIGSGEWCRARRGVYRDLRYRPPLPERAAEHHARCAGLVAALGDGVAVSHTSAARLLGLPLPPGAREELIVTRQPPASATRPGPASRAHVARFADTDVTRLHGVPVLTGPRLVLDCCAELAPPDGLALADAALRCGLVTGDGLAAELQRRRGRAGTRVTAQILARADPRAESWFESVSRWWLLESGMPKPVLQQRFVDRWGVVRARVDFWLPELRVVGEADSAVKYTEPGVVYAEKLREDWLRDRHQVEVVRWVPAEMVDPHGRAAVVARFGRAIARAARTRSPPEAAPPEPPPGATGVRPW